MIRSSAKHGLLEDVSKFYIISKIEILLKLCKFYALKCAVC